MKVVARRTGLSPHVIRVWERRYQAVQPTRTDGNRRLYRDADISRLSLLQEATHAGHSIGQIAKLADTELRALLNLNGNAQPHPAMITNGSPAERASQDYVDDGIAAIVRLDANALESVLNRATLQFGQLGLINHVLAPLVHQVGELWQSGSLKVAHEHTATAVIRTFLGNHSRAYSLPGSAPRLFITTPAGQLHELGAIMVAVTASNRGWNTSYLGPCLPAEEIAGAAIQSGARAIALSLVYPEDDSYLETELARLRQLLPAEIILLVGGRAAPHYQRTLDRIGAIRLSDLSALQAKLDEIRKQSMK